TTCTFFDQRPVIPAHSQPAAILARPTRVRDELVTYDLYGKFSLDDLDWSVHYVGYVRVEAGNPITVRTGAAATDAQLVLHVALAVARIDAGLRHSGQITTR